MQLQFPTGQHLFITKVKCIISNGVLDKCVKKHQRFLEIATACNGTYLRSLPSYLGRSLVIQSFRFSCNQNCIENGFYREKKMISFFKSLGKVLRGIRENSLIIILSPMMHRLRYIQEYMLITPSAFFKYLQRDSCHFKNDSLVFLAAHFRFNFLECCKHCDL